MVGFLLGVLQMLLTVAFPSIGAVLRAPAMWLSRLCVEGLPSLREAWPVVSIMIFVVQWFVVGLAIGLWLRHRNLKSVRQ
jgi:hypothetical protein